MPVDIESSGESGWVYRSNGREAEPPASIADAGALALGLGLAAMAQTVVLGLTIAAIPLTILQQVLATDEHR